MFNMFYIDLYMCDFVQMSTVNKPYNTILKQWEFLVLNYKQEKLNIQYIKKQNTENLKYIHSGTNL